MEITTINELYLVLADEIKKGNGNKKILLADDEEGNGYRPMYYNISPTEGNVSEDVLYGISEEEAIRDFVILG